MDLPFQIPAVAEVPTADMTDNSSISRLALSSMAAGADMIFVPAGRIDRENPDEPVYDDKFQEIFSDITRVGAGVSDSRHPLCGVIEPDREIYDEYTGGAFEDVYFDFLEKMTLLKNNGASAVLLKNSASLSEMRPAVLAANAVDIPILITLEVNDEGISTTGTDYLASLITLQALGAAGFGIYCTDGLYYATELIHRAFPHAEIPLIVVGNISGCPADMLHTLAQVGASVFLDISGTLEQTAVEAIHHNGSVFVREEEKDSYAAAVDKEVFFLPENIELSSPLHCGYDMSEDLIDLDDENINSVYVYLDSSDDAASLTENGSMSRLPLTIHANDPTVLEAALRYFCGRLIVDTRCDTDRTTLEELAKKYGAILY